MHNATDMDLLRQYAGGNSDAAFTALVSRHVNLVYSAALRKAGNPHAAEEITQAVFIILAQKAGRIPDRTILPGWLYQTTRLTAANFLKREIRRVRREQEVFMLSQFDQPQTDLSRRSGTEADETWNQLAPLLEDAMGQLGDKDRAIVVLRFFGGKSFAEVGTAAGVSENAAKKRITRALETLRRFFLKRGITSTAETIAGAISAHSVQAAPVALAKSVTAVAVAKGAAASTSTLTLIKGALKIMAWTKMKAAIVTGVCVLLAAGTTTMVVIKMQSSSLDTYLQDPELNDISNAPPMVAIQPTHFTKFDPKRPPPAGTLVGRTDGTREIGRSISLSTAILKAYGFPSDSRMIFPEELNRINVDYLVTVPDRPYERFQAEIKRKFGYIAHVETRETDVFLLRVKRPNAPGLTPADNSSWEEWSAKHPHNGGIYRHNITVSNFAELIEGLVPKPVVDQTGLTGNYDFMTRSFGSKEINQVFLDQLGLELVPSREPIEMLVVEKAK